MTPTTLIDELTSTPEGMRLFQQERLLLEVTELICGLMEEQGVHRNELAKRMGRDKSYVSRVLSGTRGLTLCNVSDMACALGCKIIVQVEPLSP